MAMNNYITTYQGVKLYLVTYDEFINMYRQGVANDGYIISDKKNALIINNKVIGHTFDGHKRLVSAQIKKDWKEVFGYKEKVLSERPTTEALVTEGSQRLEAILNEAPIVKASAEVRLNELVAEGEKAVEKVIAEGETIRSAIEPSVKRKRMNPPSRKRDRGA